MVTFTDNTVWQQGMHKGKKLANIPASWFIWISSQPAFDPTGPLGRYINDNKAALEAQAKDDARKDKFLKR